MTANLLDPAWLDWYYAQHERGFRQSATEFESHVTSILSLFHEDFMNPDPAGSLGDGGCDGVAERGHLIYACYGTRGASEYKVRDKVNGDFMRALENWGTMEKWRFVTNATFGPKATEAMTKHMQNHGPESGQPIRLQKWGEKEFWNYVVLELDQRSLDIAFPGAPGVAHVELSDMTPLLERLGEASPILDGIVRTVPLGKMEYNSLPARSRAELDAGRRYAPRIDHWFAQASLPDLKDRQAEAFRSIYLEKSRATYVPDEILERLYIAVGGSNFRQDSVRSNAVYAVTAYFFDQCDIFEEPPPGWPDHEYAHDSEGS